MSFPDRVGRSPWTVVPLLLATTALIGGAALPVRQNDPSTWTSADWHAWRDTQIAAIFQTEPDSKGGRRLSRARVFFRAREAAETMSAHASDLVKDPTMRNFVAFVQAQSLMAAPGHSLGMKVSDREYWLASAPHLAFPELLCSQEFLAKLTTPSGYKDAVTAIEEHSATLSKDQQWTVVPFVADFVLSVDKTTYGRLLVYIPNEPGADNSVYDKWIMFAIATPEMTKLPEIKSVSMVSVHRQGARPTVTYFMDFFRERDRNGNIRFVPTAVLPSNPSKNCYDCHKSGVLPIHPEAQLEFGNEGRITARKPSAAVFQYLNSQIRSYGPQDRGEQDLLAYGPSTAPKGREVSLDVIRNAAKGLDLHENSLKRIKAAMKCGSCHEDFAPLNYPQAVQTRGDLAAFKKRQGMLQTYVESGWMPPNNDLTSAERAGLWRSLIKDYFDAETQSGVLIEWLKGIGAEGSGPAPYSVGRDDPGPTAKNSKIPR